MPTQNNEVNTMTATIRKSYLAATAGQIHLRSLEARGKERHPTLICLHPAPYSGNYFTTVMPMINEGRRVVAPDYPGYGGSYVLDNAPSIGEYADEMIDSVLAAEPGDQVDLLGFHSGCLVAAEMALLAPGRVRHLLLIDVPYFDRETQQKLYDRVTQPMPLSHDANCLDKAWDFNVASRRDVVPLERALDLFVDQISTGPRNFFCFHAAFTHDCIGQFAKVTDPTTIVATRSPLLEPTRAAAAAMPHASLIEEPDIKTSVFEQGAVQIAAHIGRILDNA